MANGTDVTDFIRTPEVSKGASDVAVIPAVRLKLVKTQQETAEKYDIVMDGRDIGTYVLPDAKVKFYYHSFFGRARQAAVFGMESGRHSKGHR